MARANDVISQAVQTISGRLKEIKASDEDDLGKLADSFDQLSADADHYAGLLYRADQALGDQGEDEEDGEEQEQSEEQEEDEEQEPEQKRARK